MNQHVSKVGSAVASYAGRLVITFFVVMIFLMAFGLVSHVHQLLVSAQAGLKNPPPLYLNKPSANTRNPSVHPFWPEFPRSAPGSFQTLVLNGVQVMTEQWDCGNSPEDVLSYYRDQMTARGWHDITEKAYNLQPELWGKSENLQNKKYVDTYRQVIGSTVVLSSGDWSMRVTTAPSDTGFHQITVKIFAAATPSLDTLARQMLISLGGKQGNQPLDVVQDNGTEHYHTTIATRSVPPDIALQDKLSELAALGWKPAMSLPKKQISNGSFVWLVRGKQYAALSVAVLGQGQGSTITFSEVTPNH